MTELTLESLSRRIDALEKKLAATPPRKDWTSAVGMFDAHPELMEQVIAEAAAAREAERRAANEEPAT